jgi:hypothetical protein
MKTIKNKSICLFSAIFGLIIVCVVACDRTDPCATTEYYPAEGDGYVVDGITKQPVPYASVSIITYFEILLNGWGTQQPFRESVIADSMGYFRIRILKQMNCGKTDEFYLGASSNISGEMRVGHYEGNAFSQLKSAKETIHFGTILICPHLTVCE